MPKKIYPSEAEQQDKIQRIKTYLETNRRRRGEAKTISTLTNTPISTVRDYIKRFEADPASLVYTRPTPPPNLVGNARRFVAATLEEAQENLYPEELQAIVHNKLQALGPDRDVSNSRIMQIARHLGYGMKVPRMVRKLDDATINANRRTASRSLINYVHNLAADIHLVAVMSLNSNKVLYVVNVVC